MMTASHYNSNDINFIILDSRLAIWLQTLWILKVHLIYQSSIRTSSGRYSSFDLRNTKKYSFGFNQLLIAVSLDNILTPLICIVSGFLQQKFGPLRLLTFSCLPYTLGWVAASLATSHTTLYLSRYFSVLPDTLQTSISGLTNFG